MKRKKSLVHNEDVLFDEKCYEDHTMESAYRANSFLRYYSKNVHLFRTQLMDLPDWSPEEINELIDLLWTRVIKGARKFGVPLTPEAEHNAKRMNL